ncbi:MAG: diguanylate cyclase [Campylobacterales bacterium]
MCKRRLPLRILGLLCFGLVLMASPRSLDIAEIDRRTALAGYAQVLEDPTAALEVRDLLQNPDLVWQPLTQEAPNFAFSKSAFWIRFRLENSSPVLQKRVFEIASPLQDYLDLFIVDPASHAVLHRWQTGDRLPFDSRPVMSPDFVFPVDIPAKSQVDLYLRADTHDGLFEPLALNLWRQQAFYENSAHHLFGHSLYYGALLMMLVYKLFLYISTKERVFALYSLYLASFLMVVLTYKGVGFLYLWPASPGFQNSALALSVVAVMLSVTLFSHEYLRLKTRLPRTYRVLNGFLALVLLTLIPVALDWYAITWLLLLPAANLLGAALFGAALYLAYQGVREAIFYTLAWMAAFAAVVLYLLLMFDWVETGFLTDYGLMIGTVIQFVLIAFGLADRINRLKGEKLVLQQQALESERRLTHELETQVKERTRDLKEANEKLFSQSITDGLTGLFNRRRFNGDLAAAAQNGAFALLIMDVDNFKPYNDLYGHQAGDETLIRVAAALQKTLQNAGGNAYRVGGEEFAALAPAAHAEEALVLAEKLRQNICDLRIPHERNVAPHVTLSIGLIHKTAQARENDDTLYARADSALYEAKNAGRNCVKIAP